MLQSQLLIMSVYDNKMLPASDLPKLNNAKKALVILDSVPDLDDQLRSFKQITAIRSILKHHKGLLSAEVLDRLISFLARMAATDAVAV